MNLASLFSIERTQTALSNISLRTVGFATGTADIYMLYIIWAIQKSICGLILYVNSYSVGSLHILCPVSTVFSLVLKKAPMAELSPELSMFH
jgi:hypothetical protein